MIYRITSVFLIAVGITGVIVVSSKRLDISKARAVLTYCQYETTIFGTKQIPNTPACKASEDYIKSHNLDAIVRWFDSNQDYELRKP